MSIGRIHKLEAGENAFVTTNVGDVLEARVLSATEVNKKRKLLELTLLEESKRSTELAKERILSSKATQKGRSTQPIEALVRRVDKACSFPVMLDLGKNVCAVVHFTELAEKAEDALDLIENKLIEGEKVNCFVKRVIYKDGESTFANIDKVLCSFIERSSDVKEEGKKKPKSKGEPQSLPVFEEGQLVLCRHVKFVPGKGNVVQLSEEQFGFVDITEITDELVPGVASHLRKKGLFLGRILENSEPNNKTGSDHLSKLTVSTRDSLVKASSYKILRGDGKSKPLALKKILDEAGERGDLRNHFMKYGNEVMIREFVKQGSLLLGYVTNISEKHGCFVKIAKDLVVRAAPQEVSDLTYTSALGSIPLNTLALCRVLNIQEESKESRLRVNATLRESAVRWGCEERIGDAGQEVYCIVVGKSKAAVYVQVVGSRYKAKVKGNADKVDSLKMGERIRARILKIDRGGEGGAPKTTVEVVESLGSEESLPGEEDKAVSKVFQVVKEIQDSERERETQEEEIKQENLRSEIDRQLQDLAQLQEIEEDLALLQRDPEEMKDGLLAPDESESEAEMREIIKSSTVYEEEQDAEEEEEEEEEEGEEEEEEEADAEMEDQKGETENKGESAAEEKTKRRTLKDRIREEAQLKKKERGDGAEEVEEDDFERKLVADQSNAMLWIRYCSFALEKDGILKARQLMERALKSIDFTREDEKLNLWIAFMNLENSFGTQEQLQRVVKRAIEVNEPKRVYLALADIYRRGGALSMAIETTKVCKR